MKTILTNICRIVLAATFIFSGFVKAVDPLGTLYKLQDYASAIGLQGAFPDWLLLTCAVLLASAEFWLGVTILFAIQRKMISRLILLFMSVMTIVTLWIAIANPVKDCGCFGDAVKLSNTATLLKNIVLTACATIVAIWPRKTFRFVSKTNQWIVTNYTAIFILAVSVWCLYDLPLFDFRPYHIGTNIRKSMEIPEGAKQPKFEATFIMSKNGVKKEFTIDNYPDSTWTFVDSKTIQTEAGYEPPIHDFSMETMDGEDMTNRILSDSSYTFLLVAPRLDTADDTHFGDIDRIYEYSQEHHYHFYCLTASTEKAIEHWRNITGAEYEFVLSDETTLKTVIRSNPGLMLIKNGTIVRKWSHNRLPSEEDLNGKLEDIATGQIPEDSIPRKIAVIMIWFILPLFLLTLADRLWAWSQWLRKKENSNKYINLFKRKRNMRKKIVAGNWKMNMNLQDGVALAKEINEAMVQDKPNCEVIICTPFIHLASVAQVLNPEAVSLGAENCADKEKGAYTGEVSAEMVKSTGAQYVILGHSERRQYYGETAEILKEKVLLALKNGLKVIFCCGETLEEREAEKQNEVVKAELDGSVFNLSAEEWKNIILAYEPIWAIGTGKTATSDQAEEMLAYIRSIVAEKYGQEVADNTSILYGGSCKPSNAAELFAKPNIDGGLIGGASLKTADFKGIIDAWKK